MRSPRRARACRTWSARGSSWSIAADAGDVSAAHGQAFADVRPAATMVVVAALLDPRWRVEIEAEAIIGSTPPPLPVR